MCCVAVTGIREPQRTASVRIYCNQIGNEIFPSRMEKSKRKIKNFVNNFAVRFKLRHLQNGAHDENVAAYHGRLHGRVAHDCLLAFAAHADNDSGPTGIRQPRWQPGSGHGRRRRADPITPGIGTTAWVYEVCPRTAPMQDSLPSRKRPSPWRRPSATDRRRHAEDPPGQPPAAGNRRQARGGQSGPDRQPDQPAHAWTDRRAASCRRSK